MVHNMINETNCKPLIMPQKLTTDICQEVKDFPQYLINDQLLMHGDVAEVDPRNWESKNLMDVFLFEEFIVFTIRSEYNNISSKVTNSVHKLSDLKFFLHEKDILSMETTSGESLLPDGSLIRLFRIPENKAQEWVGQLRKLDVRVEMKDSLQQQQYEQQQFRTDDLPDVLEDQEFTFNSNSVYSKMRELKISGDYRNKPIGEGRPRSYSHDPKSPAHNADLSFAMPGMSTLEPALDQQANTSDDSASTDPHQYNSSSSERVSKRSMPRSLSVDNTPRVSMSNANKPHSLPTNLKTVKIKKHSNSKVYQYIVRTIGLAKPPDQGVVCRHIGTRYAHPSPELQCRASRDPPQRSSESESMLSILTLKPQQIAQELTRYQAEMLQAITPRELQRGAWTSKKKHALAPNVIRMIEFHNHLIKCVFGKWILQEHNIEKRAKVIKRLITVAEECKQLNNFETLYTIIQCLSLNAVRRLARTWELLSSTSKKLFTSLSSLVHCRSKWKNYRVALDVARRKGQSFLPILPVFLNYLEHSNLFYKEQDVEKLVYISEDNYSWTELSKSGSHPGSDNKLNNKASSFKWLRSKSLSTSPSPLRSHIEEKLRENVQSIVEQTSSGKHDDHSKEDTQLTMEETPLYLLRLYQLHSAQYCLPTSPIVAKFLQLPFTQCNNAVEDKWVEFWNQMCIASEKLEPPNS